MKSSVDPTKLKDACDFLAGTIETFRDNTGPYTADAIATLLLAVTPPKHTNDGLPCEFCGEQLKRLQLDRSVDGKTVQVRINWAWTKKEVGKQLKGLTNLIKSMADGLDE